MAITKKGKLKVCKKGHQFYKSSDCPVCPFCEKERKPETGMLSVLAAPARRALEKKKITTPVQLSKHSEAEIQSLHGMGKSSMSKLEAALKKAGLQFREK